MNYDLLNHTYDEAVKFPETNVGEKSITEFTIKNPYKSSIGIKVIPEDPDVYVLYAPEKLDSEESAVIKIQYSPKEDRMESLIGKLITIKVTL